MEEQFDYKKAMERLESIAKTVEDPATALDDIGGYIKEAEGLISGCRAYLRTARESVTGMQ